AGPEHALPREVGVVPAFPADRAADEALPAAAGRLRDVRKAGEELDRAPHAHRIAECVGIAEAAVVGARARRVEGYASPVERGVAHAEQRIAMRQRERGRIGGGYPIASVLPAQLRPSAPATRLERVAGHPRLAALIQRRIASRGKAAGENAV